MIINLHFFYCFFLLPVFFFRLNERVWDETTVLYKYTQLKLRSIWINISCDIYLHYREFESLGHTYQHCHLSQIYSHSSIIRLNITFKNDQACSLPFLLNRLSGATKERKLNEPEGNRSCTSRTNETGCNEQLEQYRLLERQDTQSKILCKF